MSDAKDAFKLFETINNRGLRLSPTDIIKNFLLGNAARFGPDALETARTSWASLIMHLDGTNSDAFFRYYLMAVLRVRVTAAEVVSYFKNFFMVRVVEASALPERHLYPDANDEEEDEADESLNRPVADVVGTSTDQITFNDFLSRLVQSAKVFAELVLVRTNDLRTNRRLRNLRMIKAVQTYGFLMHLRVGGCSEKLFREILELTESFVLRRHICRERANETEALFARLCGTDPAAPVEATKIAYRDLCPLDDKFREEFASVSFPANLLDRARYCFRAY